MKGGIIMMILSLDELIEKDKDSCHVELPAHEDTRGLSDNELCVINFDYKDYLVELKNARKIYSTIK